MLLNPLQPRYSFTIPDEISRGELRQLGNPDHDL
ncbi:transposase [Pseudomonas syringae pv. tomato T1]|nr:transposase [Pseudomonas syringae pv. tomato T1]